jgi:hypothetical protein
MAYSPKKFEDGCQDEKFESDGEREEEFEKKNVTSQVIPLMEDTIKPRN